MNTLTKISYLNIVEKPNDSVIEADSFNQPLKKDNKAQLSPSTYPSSLLPPLSDTKRSSFNPKALANLSYFDQLLFQTFSKGPRVTLAFSKLHHAFEHWATMQPKAIAAEHEGETISYAQLNAQSNALALHLQSLGVDSTKKIGLFVKRSINMLIGMLAVLKTGAAYVPLDVGISPKQQIEKIVDIAQLQLILCLDGFEDKIPENIGLSVLLLDQLLLKLCSKENQQASYNIEITQSDNCAFVLFTSGTTGTPNGVQVSHKNLCNILLTSPGNLQIKPGMWVSQILNIAFDMSAWEIWGALCNGASLIIRGQSITQASAKADVIIATPSILGSISLNQVKPIKTVAVAGEPCPRPLADKWSKSCAFFNSCGPTETTIINTAQRHFIESPVLSIGSPTPNNTVYILDKNLQPCPIGEMGEMWAGGDGITLGYINNPALTKERYLPDPFLGGNQRMFRTRDLGRWTKDGQLEHLGRTDDQVKIRGFRVELDAVSNYLEQQPFWSRAVTLKLNSRDLISFVMPLSTEHQQHTASALQTIAEHLPYYSLPTYIVALESLPLTDRGKIDKNRLEKQFFEHYNQSATHCNLKEQD